MTLSEYQHKTQETAIYPRQYGKLYTLMGLIGEVGELSNKLKKILRDKEISDNIWEADHLIDLTVEEDLLNYKAELGDILWYVARLSDELGFDLSDVAEANIDKLFSRKDRGVLGGSGDNR